MPLCMPQFYWVLESGFSANEKRNMARSVSELQRPSDVPAKIGKYVIINKVGKGSTGIVYLSHDPYYRRDVAIKVYNIEEDQDAERAKVSRKMFFQ